MLYSRKFIEYFYFEYKNCQREHFLQTWIHFSCNLTSLCKWIEICSKVMVTSKIGPMIYVRISKNDWPVSGTCASSTMLVGTILSTIVYDRCTIESRLIRYESQYWKNNALTYCWLMFFPNKKGLISLFSIYAKHGVFMW